MKVLTKIQGSTRMRECTRVCLFIQSEHWSQTHDKRKHADFHSWGNKRLTYSGDQNHQTQTSDAVLITLWCWFIWFHNSLMHESNYLLLRSPRQMGAGYRILSTTILNSENIKMPVFFNVMSVLIWTLMPDCSLVIVKYHNRFQGVSEAGPVLCDTWSSKFACFSIEDQSLFRTQV